VELSIFPVKYLRTRNLIQRFRNYLTLSNLVSNNNIIITWKDGRHRQLKACYNDTIFIVRGNITSAWPNVYLKTHYLVGNRHAITDYYLHSTYLLTISYDIGRLG